MIGQGRCFRVGWPHPPNGTAHLCVERLTVTVRIRVRVKVRLGFTVVTVIVSKVRLETKIVYGTEQEASADDE